MISIVDYGLGNVRAFVNMYKRMGIEATTASDAKALADATKIILPGVGAFDHAMTLLDGSGMRETLDEQVLGKRVPVLGVCVGMQILTNSSDEGTKPGLGWIPGAVVRLEPADGLKVPHMGWNTLRFTQPHPLLAGIPDGEDGLHAYFVHSYHLATDDPATLFATTQYGQTVTACVGRDNLFGTQFHPEKSQTLGLKLIENFLGWTP